jgi:hypothetical protein
MAEIIELRRGTRAAARQTGPVGDPARPSGASPVLASIELWRVSMAFWGTLWLLPFGLRVEPRRGENG